MNIRTIIKEIFYYLVSKFTTTFKEPLMKIYVNEFLRYYGRSDLFMGQDEFKPTERKIAFAKIGTLTNKIEGDYLEFGVYRGASLILAYNYISLYGGDKKCRFIGFDSFDGLPEVQVQSDKDACWKEGDFKCTLEAVEKKLSSKIKDNEFKLIKGFFLNSLTQSLKT